MPTIRISDKIYADLKVYAEADNRSISNAAEFLLSRSGMGRQNNENYLGIIERDLPPTSKITAKNNFEATPEPVATPIDVSDLFTKSKPPVAKDFPDFAENEDECCQHPSRPCKHWQWNVDQAGYVNVLSGRYREAD